MGKRRGNHEGTTFETENGTFRAQVSLNGRRISFRARTRAECHAWIKETIRNIDQGVTYQGAKITLSAFLAQWLEIVRTSRSLSTLYLYTRTLKNGVVPFLGNFKLMDIRPDMIQSLYSQLLSKGKSAHAVRMIHKTLNAAFNHALKLGLIGRNPCQSVTAPKPEETEMQILTEDQIQILLSAAQEVDDPHCPIYYLAINTGMRQAELLGLKWSDLDWKTGRLRIVRQALWYKGSSYQLKDLKTRRSRRSVRLGEHTLAVLRAHRDAVFEMQRRAGPAWADLDLVFPTRLGTPIQSCNLRRSFRKILETPGLPKIRFHDLRHTAASMMLNIGISVAVVSRILGHSKVSITMDIYWHLIPDQLDDAGEAMDDLMSPVDISDSPLFSQGERARSAD
ncbi:MAG: site-specific integrase [Anaerolineae bacterium]|nr:MAG: site-specific integrase [Anaerolineae bacterium]